MAGPLDTGDLTLAGCHRRSGTGPDGLPEQYLYSDDLVHRYAFSRWWDAGARVADLVCWVGLNPATGDTDHKPRPTLRRMMDRSRQLGAGGVLVVNLFAFRATKPRDLIAAAADLRIGSHDDVVLAYAAAVSRCTVAAWGAHGRIDGRSRRVRPLLPDALCLGVTAAGEPRHPLYVPGDQPLYRLP